MTCNYLNREVFYAGISFVLVKLQVRPSSELCFLPFINCWLSEFLWYQCSHLSPQPQQASWVASKSQLLVLVFWGGMSHFHLFMKRIHSFQLLDIGIAFCVDVNGLYRLYKLRFFSLIHLMWCMLIIKHALWRSLSGCFRFGVATVERSLWLIRCEFHAGCPFWRNLPHGR